MVNVSKLKGKIVEHGMSIGILADKMGINKATLYRKLSGNGDNFTIFEANKLAEILELDASEAQTIFFSQVVARRATFGEED